MGHEFIGVDYEVGSSVTHVRPGDFVIAPFAYSDGVCRNCEAGFHTACIHGGFFGQGIDGEGGQAEYVRVPQADGTLVTVPGTDFTDERLASLLALTDVMATGYHAAVSAEVEKGHTVAAAVLNLTDGYGADAVLECVGTGESMQTPVAATRPGGIIGRVGFRMGCRSTRRGRSTGTSVCGAARRRHAPTNPNCSSGPGGQHRPRSGVRPDRRPGPDRRGLPGHGRAPGHQGSGQGQQS